MAPPPRTDDDLNGDYFSSSYIHRRHHHFDGQPRHLPTSTAQQVVPYDESSESESTGRTGAKTTKQQRWTSSSSSSSSASSSSSSIQPRAEISFPLHWEPDKRGESSSSSSSSSTLRWKRHQSRITATTTLPLYQSQDALFDNNNDHHHADNDNDHHPKKKNNMSRYGGGDSGRQEIVCHVSLTTLQQEFRDAALFGSCQLRATHYHPKGRSNNDNSDNDIDRAVNAKQPSKTTKTSLVLSVHRRGQRPTDVVSLAAEHTGRSYAISAVTVLWPQNSYNNNNNKFNYNIDNSNSSNFRIAAHCDWQVVHHHGRRQFGVVTIRPDIRVAVATAPSSAGLSIIVHDGSTFASRNSSSSSSRRSPPAAALPLWHVRCGCIRDNDAGWWKPTIRLHWTFPFFVGKLHWTYGGSSSSSSSTMIQYEASWKAKINANSSVQMSVTTADILHATACRWMIAYTLSDVTIRIPILIAAASSSDGGGWQRHLLYWGLTSAVSHLVHGTVQDMFGRTNNNHRNRRPKKHNVTSTDNEPPSGQKNNSRGRRHTALMQQHFMQRQATLRYRDEEKKRDNGGGLLIETATYYYYRCNGKKVQKFDVTIPLRFWVTDSKLELFAESKRSLMLGFYNLAAAADEDDDEDDGDNEEERKQTNGSTWSKRFQVAVRRLFWAPTTIIRDESASSAEQAEATTAATATARPKSGDERHSMVLEICYRYHGTRYSITVGDEEHVILPSSRATEMTG